MSEETLTLEERRLLLSLARRSIEQAVCNRKPLEPDLNLLPPRLRETGVSFVTLTLPDGRLRGCIGALEASYPLAVDVCIHAAAAALEDYRFLPVRPEEIPLLRIEISRLTPPQPLEYAHPLDLPNCIRPHIDGVVLRDGPRRATFLPQVWDKIEDPCEFLSNLCIKLGGSEDLWKRKKLTVEIYQVEEFQEEA